MNVQDLMGPLNPQGLPAPLWFLTLFKVIGFILHLWPMHLFLAGSLIAAVLLARGGPLGRRLSARLGSTLPFAVALGVNFGIVPLLFVQVSHYRVFYPSTILMAWPWFSIVPLLTLGYYGIYLYAWQARNDRVNRLGKVGIGIAALFFAVIGFIFVNAFSLMARPEGWPALMERTSVSGAFTGLALNLGDPTLVPRWLMGLGLALCSAAAWVAVDTAFFATREGAEYAGYAKRLAVRLYAAGAAVVVLLGGIYVFVAMPAESREFLLSGPRLPLFVLTAISPGLGLLAVAWVLAGGSPRRAWVVFPAHYTVLILNVIARQMLQSHQLSDLQILGAEEVVTQWSTLPLFLVLFVASVGLVVWMLRRVWVEAALGAPPPEGS
ncbi:MAG: hypothetical protein HUU35_05470 [Armatimonadetes bacterium]|nr:hypothetical protein [Armatimonadota bacterium]